MEKTVEKGTGTIVRIILTGPESTGKTMLATELASRFGTTHIPEYAREYVENLDHKYTYNDVLNIAIHQVKMMESDLTTGNSLVFVDTYLIITKVWFRRVFGKYPEWIDNEISKTKNALYLLCKPDLPWVADSVRENGGTMRDVLFQEYENELRQFGLNYSYVEGIDNMRIENALKEVNNFLKYKN